MLCTNKKKKQIHRLPLYVFKQKSLSINCKILNWCSQLDKQQPPVFPSFRFHQFLQQPSSSNFQQLKIHDCIDSIERKRKYA